MRKLFIIVTFILYTAMAIGQINQQLIDKVKSYPNTFKHYDKLAKKILHDFNNDKDRAAAIFTWIALNIKYDVNALYSQQRRNIQFTYRTQEEKLKKEQEIREKIAFKTLSKQKAVYQEYSELFRLLCFECNIECETVSDFSKTLPTDIGKALKANIMSGTLLSLMVNGTWLMPHEVQELLIANQKHLLPISIRLAF